MITKVAKSFIDQGKNGKITDVYYLLVIFSIVIGLQLGVIIGNPANDPLGINIVSSFASIFGVFAAVQMTRRNVGNFFGAFLSSIGIGLSTLYSGIYLQGCLELFILIPMYGMGIFHGIKSDGFEDEIVKSRDMKKSTFTIAILSVFIVSIGLMGAVSLIPGEGEGVSRSLSLFMVYVDTAVLILGMLSEYLILARYNQAGIGGALVNILGCTNGIILIANGNTAMISVFSIQAIFLVNTIKGYFDGSGSETK